MIKNFIEIPFANGFRIIIGKGSSVVVSLENPDGYIISDNSLTDRQVEKLSEILTMF